MTTEALATQAGKLEAVLLSGDLSKLTQDERVVYYRRVCGSLGLNWLTTPFAYIVLNGKLTLYAQKGCTDQLRKNNSIGIRIVSASEGNGYYTVIVEGTTPDGRTDSDIGVVHLAGLKGEAYSNAMMKCVTKAKRRCTLSIVGLGMLDESEVASIPPERRRQADVDVQTGEIMGIGAPTEAVQPPQDIGAYQCPIHEDVDGFFKRGKMRSFAHPLEDGEPWCNATDVLGTSANTPDEVLLGLQGYYGLRLAEADAVPEWWDKASSEWGGMTIERRMTAVHQMHTLLARATPETQALLPEEETDAIRI